MHFTFDFSKVCNQGAYFSSFTPTSLQHYLDDLAIPPPSSYHAVACSPSLLPILSQMQTAHIVQKCKDLFAQRKTVIDLLLPYYNSTHHKSYLARYIIFRGQLLGIRISTGKSPLFHSWPRAKTKELTVKDSKSETEKSQTNILMGQFTLNLRNLRIGLLFDNEIMSLANEYINCCFDILLITCEHHQNDSQLRAKIKELAIRVQIIQVTTNHAFQHLQLQHLQALAQAFIPFPQKPRIKIAYYTFDKIYANKQWLQFNQTALPSLEIDFQPFARQGRFDSQSTFYSHHKIESQIEDPTNLEKAYQLYLNRLLNLFSFNGGNKIILIVEQSPSFLCLLYILKLLFDKFQFGIQHCLKNLFHMVGFASQQFDSFLLRTRVISPQDIDRIKDQEQSLSECAWLKKLHQYANNTNQQWFSILAMNCSLENVVQLLNKRFNSQKNYQNQHHLLQTFLVYQFLSYEELVNIYFSESFRQFIDNDEYISELWTKHPFYPKLHEDPLISPPFSLQTNHRNANFIQYEFEKWISGFESTLPREQLFSHFLFRRIGTIRPTYTPSRGQFSTNFHQQLLSLPKTSIIQVLALLRQAGKPAAEFERKILASQRLADDSQNCKHCCHSCHKKLQRSQLFGCSLSNCSQYFCLKCLTVLFSYQSAYLLHILGLVQGKSANLNICPCCQHLCPSSCPTCKKNNKASQNHKVQQGQACHLCKSSSNSQSFQSCPNPSCPVVFCQSCLPKSQLKTPETQMHPSPCSVCQNKCRCTNCQKKIKTNLISKITPFALNAKNVNIKYGNIQLYNKSSKPQPTNYFQFKNRPNSCQNHHQQKPDPRIPLKNDSEKQQTMESLGIRKQQREVDQQSCPTSKTVRIAQLPGKDRK